MGDELVDPVEPIEEAPVDGFAEWLRKFDEREILKGKPPISPDSRPYKPRGGAERLLYCRDPEILLDGPAGTGKTRAVLEKLHICTQKFPGMRALIARKTRESLTESALVTWEEKVIPAGSTLIEGPDRARRQRYDFDNGSEVVVGGLDKWSKIMSTEYDLIVVPEATELSVDEWEALTTRLRNGVMPFQQIIGDCNPGPPRHWLNLRCESGATTRILSRHTDNPSVSPAYLQKLKNLTGARRARLYEGKWASAEGLIFDFDAAVHLIDRFEPPIDWRRVISIDFGFVHPFVCQFWAIDPDGRMYLYREHYMTGRTVKSHVPTIARFLDYEQDRGARFEIAVADHDREDRATLEEEGLPTVPAYKDVSTGIQAVNDRLVVQPDGRPRLYIMRDAVLERDPALTESKRPASTWEETGSYVWAPAGPTGRAKEAPLKVDDDGCDAMRYAVAYVDKLGGRVEASYEYYEF